MPDHSILITGSDENISDFHLRVVGTLKLSLRIGQTCRYDCHDGDIGVALRAAQESNVTVQRVECLSPALYLGTHKMMFEIPAEKEKA